MTPATALAGGAVLHWVLADRVALVSIRRISVFVAPPGTRWPCSSDRNAVPS